MMTWSKCALHITTVCAECCASLTLVSCTLHGKFARCGFWRSGSGSGSMWFLCPCGVPLSWNEDLQQLSHEILLSIWVWVPTVGAQEAVGITLASLLFLAEFCKCVNKVVCVGFRVCKVRACLSAVNTHSQNSVRNNRIVFCMGVWGKLSDWNCSKKCQNGTDFTILGNFHGT